MAVSESVRKRERNGVKRAFVREIRFLSLVKWELHLSLSFVGRVRGAVGGCFWEQKGGSREPLLWKFYPGQDCQELAALPSSLGTGSCPQEETVLSCLEGEFCDHSFPSQADHRYCDPWAGTTVSSCFRSFWDWLPVKPIYSSLLLTASARLVFRPCWANLILSTLAASDLTFCFSQHDQVGGLPWAQAENSLCYKGLFHTNHLFCSVVSFSLSEHPEKGERCFSVQCFLVNIWE